MADDDGCKREEENQRGGFNQPFLSFNEPVER